MWYDSSYSIFSRRFSKQGHKVGIATQSHFDNDKNVEILNGVEINRFRIRRNLLKYPVEVKLFIDFCFCVVNMMYTYLSALGALHLIF